MRNFLLGAVIAALLVFGTKYFVDRSNTRKIELQSSDLILNQIKNVGKLVVTEGHFSEVINYKEDKKVFSFIPTVKTALVVVNAKVEVSYDLSKIDYILNKDIKTVVITKIPKPEININPNIKYHSLQYGLLNQYNPKDHNLIRKKVVKQLEEKVKKSSLVTNSENRLISELQNIYILTNSLGWTLKYNNTVIDDQVQLEEILD